MQRVIGVCFRDAGIIRQLSISNLRSPDISTISKDNGFASEVQTMHERLSEGPRKAADT